MQMTHHFYSQMSTKNYIEFTVPEMLKNDDL